MSEGTVWDAPNQQVVRADGSGPWEEGTGGSGSETPEPTKTGEPSLDEMTKAQLMGHADGLGVEVHDEMTKAEIRAAIEEAEA